MPRKGSKEALELELEKVKKELAKARDEARPPSQQMLELGPAPDDTLGIQKHGLRMLALDLDEVKEDMALTPAQRRAERRAICDSMTRLVPHSRRYEAEQAIKDDRAELERTKPKGPALVPAPPAAKPVRVKKARKPRKEKKAPRARRDAGAQLVPAPKP